MGPRGRGGRHGAPVYLGVKVAEHDALPAWRPGDEFRSGPSESPRGRCRRWVPEGAAGARRRMARGGCRKPAGLDLRALWLEDGRLRMARRSPPPELIPGSPGPRPSGRRLQHRPGAREGLLYPYTGIPGHEFVGRVRRLPGRGLDGKRVVGGSTPSAATARPAGPGARRTASGAPSGNSRSATGLRRVPVAAGREPARGARRRADEWPSSRSGWPPPSSVREQVRVGPWDRVVVIGSASFGHLVAQALGLTGCGLLVIGRNAATLAFWRAGACGTGTAPGLARPPGRRRRGVHGKTRTAWPLAPARGASARHGRARAPITARPPSTRPVVVDEVALVGSRCGPFAPALALLAGGQVEVRPLVEARYPLSEAAAAFDTRRGPVP